MGSAGPRAHDNARPFCAVVTATGSTSRLRGECVHPATVANGDRADLHPDLIQVARGALRDDLDTVTFRWRGGNRLYRITVTVADAEAEVVVEPDAGLPVTTRELEVLTLLSGGLTNAEIAARLMLSPRTVTTHVDRVLTKLGAAGRTSAAIIAMNHGLMLLPVQGGTRGLEHVPLIRASCALPAPRLVQPSRRIKLQPLVIGAAVPLTGQARSDGVEMVRGTELALREINARGGVNGRRVELATADVDITSRTSIEQAMLSLAERNVDAFTSGYFAWQDIAHEIAADHGAPYLHAATLQVMADRVRDNPARYGRIFQVCPSDTNYGPGFVSFLQDLRTRDQWRPSSRTLVVLQGGWEVTDLGLEHAADIAASSGWELLVIPVGPTERDWARCADRIRDLDPAAVMVGDYFINGALAFIRALLTAAPDALIYCLYAPSIPEFRQRLGEQAEGIIWATTTGTYSDPVGTTFADSYRRAYGVAPGRSHAGISYDRAMILANAWSRTTRPHDHRMVAEELRSGVHRGVNGVYYMGAADQSARAYPASNGDGSLALAHLVYQIQGNGHRILSPASQADGTFRLPPWFDVAAR